MTGVEKAFALIVILNTVTVVLYLVWNVFLRGKSGEAGAEYRMKAVVMILCPVVGALFFLGSNLIYHLFRRQDVDLEDVIFSKERVKVYEKADEEREGNYVPMEEALAVSDRDNLRKLVMDVARGDVQNTLASLALALNSEDSETSHYAATVLRDVLNEFREHSQELYLAMERGGEFGGEYAVMLLEYMNGVLAQDVFDEMEQTVYVDMMEKACRWLYDNDTERLQPLYLEWLCNLLLKIKQYGRMEVWCGRSRELYPEELSGYMNYLKLYFTTGNRKRFFEVLNGLKKSDIIIDKETVELIRTFT